MDYDIIVVSDGCADPDEEMHDVLVRKVFPRQTAVVTAQEFIAAI
jgi:isochorismate hydrolase